MKKVFVSYSRKDLAFVKRLADDLQKAGLDVWFDISDIKGGDRWLSAIQNGIESSQYCIVVLSPDSVASTWVSDEYLHARDSKLKLVPVLYKPCKIPLGLNSVQFVDLQGDNYRTNFEELLQVLDVHARDDQTIKPARPAPFKLDWRIGGVIGVIAALILGAIYFLNPPPAEIIPSSTPSATVKVDSSVTASATIPHRPTSTPTESPTPTVTPQPGADWKSGCIYTGYWKTNVTTSISAANDCWDLSRRGATLENGALIFNQPQAKGDTLFGIYLPLEGNVAVSFNLQIDQLSIRSGGSFANFSVGLLPAEIGDLSSENLMFYEVNSSADKTAGLKKKENGAARDSIFAPTLFARRYTYKILEKVTFDILNNKLSVYRDADLQFTEDITYRERVFWIGFHLTEGAKLWASISDITIEQK
jgi:hypothetical protein